MSPGASIPSPLVTKTIGFELLFSDLSTEFEEDEEGCGSLGESEAPLDWSPSSAPAEPPFLRLRRTSWRLETSPGGKRLFFFSEVEVMGTIGRLGISRNSGDEEERENRNQKP